MTTNKQITISKNSTAVARPADYITRTVAQLDRIAAIQTRQREFWKARISYDPYEIRANRASIRRASEWIGSADFADALAAVAQAAEPAPRDIIARELRRLASSWHTAKSDLALFGAELAAEVMTLRLSWYGIAAGCRELRLSCDYPPTICKAITTLKDAEDEILAIKSLLQTLPECIAPRMAQLEQLEQDEAALAAERKGPRP